MSKKEPTTTLNGYGLMSISFGVLIATRISSFYFDIPFLFERGFIQYVTVTAFSFVFFFCVAKLILIYNQRNQMKDLWLSDYIKFDKPDSQELADFASRLRDRKDLLSYVMRRVIKIYIKTESRDNTLDYLQAETELRREKVYSTFTFVRTICYSLPMLGFLGTVIGISQSIGKFSTMLNGSSNLLEIKQTIGGVTGGMSTAFDTTLLALTLGIISVVLLSLTEDYENGLHNSVEEYCNENLIPRIPGTKSPDYISPLERIKAKNAARTIGISPGK